MSIIRQCIKCVPFLLLLSVSTMALSVAADLLIPWLLQQLIDEGVALNQSAVIIERGKFMLITVFFGLIAGFVAYWSSAKASAQIGQTLREQLYAQILSLNHETYTTLSASSLITRLSNDILHIKTCS